MPTPHQYERGEMTIPVVALVKALMHGWRTVPELARVANTSKRTVYRYLRAMESAELPLAVDRDVWNDRARYRLL